MSTEFVLSPRFRRSPFYDATVRHGVKGFSVYNKTYLPMAFSDPETEFWQLVDGVALWDVAGQRIVEISGPDGFAFANLLVPRDLNKCAVGQCKYVVVTAPDGGILNDPVLLRLEENRFWLSRADSDILMWAQGVAVFAGMDVEVREPDVGTLQLQGPKSRDVAVALFGADVAELAYYDLVETALDGMPLVVARTGWSAELGYEIYLRDTARADDLWEAIMAAGSAHGIAPGCPSRIRRIEAGIYDYSVDIDAATPSLRGRARPARRSRPGERLHRQGGAPAHRGRGRHAQARRHRGRWRTAALQRLPLAGWWRPEARSCW